MEVLGLDHVQVAAPAGCEPAARRFFGELLGMQEIAKPAPVGGRGGVWFRCGAGELHVGVEDNEFAPARKAHPALAVAAEQIDSLAERLANEGAAVVWDASLPGVRRFFTSDPWGNRLELVASGEGRAGVPGIPGVEHGAPQSSETQASPLVLRWSAGERDMRGAVGLRERVFCGEQGVSPEEELDGRDDEALHLVAVDSVDELVIGTLRLLLDEEVAKIGRVAVDRRWRRCGIAARMLAMALEAARERGAVEARLAAQTDAIALYEQAGFRVVSGRFLSARIVHVWMSRPLPSRG